jgi:hypothetical protein
MTLTGRVGSAIRTGVLGARSIACLLVLRGSVVLAAPFPTDPVAARVEAARMAGSADADREALAAALLAPRALGPDAYRKLFLAMWAQVPNWKSGDPLWIKRAEPPFVQAPKGQPRLKRPPPHDPEKLDWFEALLTVPLTDLEVPFAFEGLPKVELPPVPPEQREALREDALRTVATLHALAATHRPEAVVPMFKLAFQLDGVFRDECGRQIRAIGDPAVAKLVRLQYERGAPTAPLAKQRRYAVYQLDRMDRARPSKALAAAPDDALRAELLHVYGEVRAPDAVDAVLDQVNAQGHRVRKEARWAFRRYVEGPPPPPAPKRKRRLPGGKEESEEKPDYLTYREIAELSLQRRIGDMGLQLADAHPTPLAMFEAIVAHDDQERAAEWERSYVAALERANAGDAEAAVREYEWILAHDPTSARRLEMAPAFERAAAAREKAGKLDEAAGLLWKAAALAPPQSPDNRRLECQALFLDAERARLAGKSDERALRRAAALGHPRAQAEIAQIDRAQDRREARRLAFGMGGATAALALSAFLLAWLARRAR